MGYRDTSNYEPYGTMNQGRPLRPFNWVQWAGVGFAIFGIAVDLLYFTGRLGWTPAWMDSPALAMPFLLLGILLVNSRREAVPDLAPELAAQRKRLLLITTIILAVVLGAATVIQFSGA
jgi:hypothetical protein